MIRIFIALALSFAVSIALADGKHTPTSDYEKMTAEEQTEFDQLTDTLIEQWCDYNTLIASSQESVDRQKRIQKVSGTTDLNALHAAGSMIVDFTEKRSKAEKTYKELFGKDLKKSQCEDL